MPPYCPIWGEPWECQTQDSADSTNGILVNSPRAGGTYKLPIHPRPNFINYGTTLKVNLSRWIYEQNLFKAEPLINEEILANLNNAPLPTITQQIDALLQTLELATNNQIGREFLLHFPLDSESTGLFYLVEIKNSQSEFITDKLLAASSISSAPELRYLLTEAANMRLIWTSADIAGVSRSAIGPIQFKILAKGYERIDQMRSRQTKFSQAFVAMWFDTSMEDAWSNGFKPGIEDAGYKPLRIDRKEHNNKIDDEIIAEIRRSRFLVADFTSEPESPRGGVYYEAGFAHGLNIPVIFTCRHDMIHQVHFDTRQFNHILWNPPPRTCERN